MDHCSAGLNAWIPIIGTLSGVVLGAVLGYVFRELERRRELRSVLQALLWELRDAKLRLSADPAILVAAIPSVETLLTGGC